MNKVLEDLSDLIKRRKNAPSEKSYTASLLQSGTKNCSKKFGEEAAELVIAAVSENLEKFNNEAADVLYHLLVLIESKESDLSDILFLLAQRQGMSGHTEKKNRQLK